jgi:hypothetical protein
MANSIDYDAPVILGVPAYYGEDYNGVFKELKDEQLVEVAGKLFKFYMSDSGYVGSRYRVHNNRDNAAYVSELQFQQTPGDPIIPNTDSTSIADTTVIRNVLDINDLEEIT